MTDVQIKKVWITPNASELLVYMARVSSPQNQVDKLNDVGLIKYLLGWRKGKFTFNPPHWSPFEMVHACFEINTTRDIGRQILRHRSFAFQEFSQRYADTNTFENLVIRDSRLQDHKNRQNSIETSDAELRGWWHAAQRQAGELTSQLYRQALDRGIAKEVARAVLPEGLTPTRLYMVGSFRSWVHYLDVRTHASTQKEHREVAEEIGLILAREEPILMAAIEGTAYERGRLQELAAGVDSGSTRVDFLE